MDGSNGRDAVVTLEETHAPAEAFATLGDETRVAILRALAGRDGPVPFSELRDAVGVDDSGRFNYHLDRLVGRFVTRTDEGYRLDRHGRRVAETVRAGRYTAEASVDPVPIEGRCYDCGAASLRAGYADQHVHVDCTDCGVRVLRVGFPASGLAGRTLPGALEAFRHYSRQAVNAAAEGVCPGCAGRVEPSLFYPDGSAVDFEVTPAFDCAVCGHRVVTSFAAVASRHEPVEAFYEERDASLDDRPYWEVAPFVDGSYTTVERKPLRATVAFPAPGDGDEAVLRATVGPSFEVVDVAVTAP